MNYFFRTTILLITMYCSNHAMWDAYNNNDTNTALTVETTKLPYKGQRFIVIQKGRHEGKMVEFLECSKTSLIDALIKYPLHDQEPFKDRQLVEYIMACLKNYDERARIQLTLAISGNKPDPETYIKKAYLYSYGYLVRSTTYKTDLDQIKKEIAQRAKIKKDTGKTQEVKQPKEDIAQIEEFYVHPSWLEKVEKQLTQ